MVFENKGAEFVCRLCSRNLSPSHNGLYSCHSCQRNCYLDEHRGGFCEQLDFDESFKEVRKLMKQVPEAEPEQLAGRFYQGDGCLRPTDISLQEYILEVRRLFYLSKSSDVGLNADEVIFLRKFTDALEKCRKALSAMQASPYNQSSHVEAASGTAKSDSVIAAVLSSARPEEWLQRYTSGQYEQVWEEMLLLGERIRDEPFFSAAKEVVVETMTRVRHNAQLLYKKLIDIDYSFGDDMDEPEDFEPFVAPAPDVEEQLDKHEAKIGRLPMSVRYFSMIVGTVRFAGRSPKINCELSDPLWFDLLGSLWHEFDAWESEWYEGCEPLWASISPNDQGKAGEYDEPQYAIVLPDASVDCQVKEERHETTFVNMLRICFKWGGFPGFQLEHAEPPAICQELAQGMLDF
jgi:hypothetical protein